jgi:hypothetical protein
MLWGTCPECMNPGNFAAGFTLPLKKMASQTCRTSA